MFGVLLYSLLPSHVLPYAFSVALLLLVMLFTVRVRRK
jgi:hypothetical protein